MTQPSSIKLAGGLDLVTPQSRIPPGMCIDAGNFVPEINGGYKRIGGYDKFDGRTRPWLASYWIAIVDTTSLLSVGNTVTGATSTKTAKVISIIDSTHVLLTKRSGAFTNGENLQVGGVTKAVLTSMAENSETDLKTHCQYRNLAVAEYRADIGVVPGSGPVRGVWVYDGNVYAFRNDDDASECKMYVATAGGWSAITTGVTLNPGGWFEFVNYNFSGASTGLKMYGVDGKNKAFQWDGTTFTQITSTASTDTPSHIAVWRNRLVLSVYGSLFYSGGGTPTTGWTAATAGEIGTGDEITGLVTLPGDNSTTALAVYGRNKTSILYGAPSSALNLAPVSPDTGALPGTAQYVGSAIALDDRGVSNLAAVQEFGNFAAATISRVVQPFIDNRIGLASASSVLRSQNQYRLYFSDGYGLAFRIDRESVEIMPIYYPDPVTCIVSGEDIGGEEVIFFGSTDGYVYQAEVGTSFAGDDIEAWIRLAFNNEGSETGVKRWRKLWVELSVPEYAELNFTYEQDYGNYSIPVAATALDEFAETKASPGGGGFWDQFTWDQFTWDSPLIDPPPFDLHGSARNMSPLFFTKDAISEAFTIQNVVLHTIPRRLKR